MGVAALHAPLVGLHGAIEAEEIGILAVGVGKDAIAFGIALAAEFSACELASASSTVTSRSALARISWLFWLPWARNSAASRCRSVCMR